MGVPKGRHASTDTQKRCVILKQRINKLYKRIRTFKFFNSFKISSWTKKNLQMLQFHTKNHDFGDLAWHHSTHNKNLRHCLTYVSKCVDKTRFGKDMRKQVLCADEDEVNPFTFQDPFFFSLDYYNYKFVKHEALLEYVDWQLKLQRLKKQFRYDMHVAECFSDFDRVNLSNLIASPKLKYSSVLKKKAYNFKNLDSKLIGCVSYENIKFLNKNKQLL